MTQICPKCGQNTLRCSMRADYCPECEYEERYEDAYRDTDPENDFPDAEEFC